MDLRVTFGWHLDGTNYPEHQVLGSAVYGPMGLMQQLALRLGLLGDFSKQPVRIAEYLFALRKLDDGRSFFSRSFAVDEWGTARSLLQLRDELTSAGYNFDTTEHPSTRIQALAQLENETDGKINCLTDQLRLIAEAIEAGARVPFSSIELLDNVEYLPPIWRRILRALSSSGILVSQRPISGTIRSDDAGHLSLYLSDPNAACELKGDGTFVVVESDDEIQAADFLSTLLNANRNEIDENTLIIKSGRCSFLDSLLNKMNLPGLGSATSSKYRSGLQLLTLAIDMSWNPVNPTRLVELLLLPDSPIPKYAADCFIHAIKNHPGIGGVLWDEAWSMALRRLQSALEKDATIDNVVAKLDEAKSLWKEWLEPRRYNTIEGIPAPDLVAICKRVRAYAVKVASVSQRKVYEYTAEYAETLLTAVNTCGMATVTRAQLDRILDSVLGDGYAADMPEASPWTSVTHPGKVYGFAKQLIWWGFVDDIQRPHFYPWSDQETVAFDNAGILIDKPLYKILREAASWRRPLAVSAEQILLIKPRTIAGEETRSHPFFHEIVDLLDRTPSSVRKEIVVQAHVIYEHAESAIGKHNLHRILIKRRPFPKSSQIVSISPLLIEPQQETPSSLKKLLGCPFAWLLANRAYIRKGSILSIAEGEQLSGNLAHAVLAEVFQDPFKAPALIRKASEKMFDHLCPQIAAPLLLPGKSLERQNLKLSICNAAEHLFVLITAAGFETMTCEQEQHIVSNDIELISRIDMVLQHPNERDYVLDLKWTNNPAYRKREIAEGLALELAIYAWMNNKKSGCPTDAGYYLLNQKQLFSSSQSPFTPNTFVEGPSLGDTFEKINATYLHHMKLLNEGTVYVTGLAQPSPGREKSVVVPGVSIFVEPPCKFCDYGRLCGKQEMIS